MVRTFLEKIEEWNNKRKDPVHFILDCSNKEIFNHIKMMKRVRNKENQVSFRNMVNHTSGSHNSKSGTLKIEAIISGMPIVAFLDAGSEVT